MSWPKTFRKRITYLLVAPIIFPLYLTLPDTRTPRGKKFFPITFMGSILWIAAYSYLMVWWANVAGDTAKIPPEVSCTAISMSVQILMRHACVIYFLFAGDGTDIFSSWYLNSRSNHVCDCGAKGLW